MNLGRVTKRDGGEQERREGKKSPPPGARQAGASIFNNSLNEPFPK